MKNLIWIALAVVIVLGGYLMISGRSIEEAAEAVDVPAATESAGEVASDAATAVEETASAAVTAAENTAEAAADTATSVVESVTDAVEGAVDTATQAASEAAEAVTGAGTEIASAATDTANATAEAASTAASEATDALDVLTVEGFDLDKLTEMIQTSSLDDAQKTLLITSVEQVQNSPELLETALATVKEALGL